MSDLNIPNLGNLSGFVGVGNNSERIEQARRQQYKEYQRVLCFVLLWVVAIAIAVHGIVVPDHTALYQVQGYAGDYGYTRSLTLMYLPLLFLFYWYVRNRDELQLRPILRTMAPIIAVIGGAWIALDVFLANLFFAFPFTPAHVEWLELPGFKWDATCNSLSMVFVGSCYERNIPFEEAAFYIGGALIMQMLYLWAAEDFYSMYTLPRPLYVRLAKEAPPLVHPNMKLLLAGLLTFAVGVLHKWYATNHQYHDGLPWYLFAELLIVFVPLTLLYDRVKMFTNPPAFLFVMFVQIMISMIWEATFGLPLGWWNYNPELMAGAFVGPWENLPLEACILWLSVGWGSLFTYEATKIKALSERTWRQVLLGRDSWLP